MEEERRVDNIPVVGGGEGRRKERMEEIFACNWPPKPPCIKEATEKKKGKIK